MSRKGCRLNKFKDNEFGFGLEEFGWDNDSFCHREEERKCNKAHNEHFNRKEHDKACDENRSVNKHTRHDVDAHRLNKEFEDKHKKRNHQESKEVENVHKRNRNNKNKKYLVDELYIYEHRRVIDLNNIESEHENKAARKDFKDLECAIEDFKEADINIKNFSDENRKDFEAYENARAKTRDLQAHKRNNNSNYFWSN